jgi:hypothetical protein
MDLVMVSTTDKEQPWSKASISEDLTWLIDQTKVFTKRVQNIHVIHKDLRV